MNRVWVRRLLDRECGSCWHSTGDVGLAIARQLKWVKRLQGLWIMLALDREYGLGYCLTGKVGQTVAILGMWAMQTLDRECGSC